MVRMALTKNKFTLLDDADYEAVKRWKWQFSTGHPGYATRATRAGVAWPKCRTLYLHRELMKPPEGRVVDHINGDTLDNRRENLRICTPAQNRMNRRKHKTTSSVYKGVRKTKYNTWEVSIGSRITVEFIGTFQTEVEAALAYNEAAIRKWGEFASLNEIKK